MNEQEALLLSVIVPVYNVVDYLPQCLDSILKQPFRAYELILVDDGSTDGCAAICDAYANKDERVRVIHKENGGLSDARNAGVRIATGQYLLFVDSDDYIEVDSLVRIAEALREDGFPDVLFLKARRIYPDGMTKPYGYPYGRADFSGKSRQEVLARLSSGNQFHVSACIKAVKRELVNEIGGFWKGVVGEDVDFSMALYLAAKTYGCCEALYYAYRQERSGSIMAQKSDKRFCDLLRIIQKWTAVAQSADQGRQTLILRFMYHQYYTLLLVYCRVSRSLKTAQTKRALRRLSFLLRHGDQRKTVVLCLVYRACGVAVTARLLAQMEARRRKEAADGTCVSDQHHHPGVQR